MNNKNFDDLIQNAYDLHVHIGPEVIPRKYTVNSLLATEKDRIAGMALKNHFYPTAPFIAEVKPSKIRLFASVVLNNFVGGLNSDAIYATRAITNLRFIVWFPTVNSKQFLTTSKWEIPPEWLKNKQIPVRKAKSVMPITITDKNGRISSNCEKVIQAIKQADAVLATGHISWKESEKLVSAAIKMGLKRIIITHPIYSRINMPIAIQKRLIQRGAVIEQCYSMYGIDDIPIKQIALQINEVGAENCILTSDVGQKFSPSPSEALKIFSKLLFAERISWKDLETMLVTNPKRIMDI